MSLGQRSSAGSEFHSTGRSRVSERPVQDSSTGCDGCTVQSDELRRSGGASWMNASEIRWFCCGEDVISY